MKTSSDERFYRAVAVGLLLATVGGVSYVSLNAELVFTPRRLERHGTVNTDGTGVVRETKGYAENLATASSSSATTKRYYSRVQRFSGSTLTQTRETSLVKDAEIIRDTWESRRAEAAKRRQGIADAAAASTVRTYQSVRESIVPEDYENRRVIRVLERSGEGTGTTGSRAYISVRDREIARTAWEKRQSIRTKSLVGSGATTSAVRATNYRDSEEVIRETWTPRVRVRTSSSSSSSVSSAQ